MEHVGKWFSIGLLLVVLSCKNKAESESVKVDPLDFSGITLTIE